MHRSTTRPTLAPTHMERVRAHILTQRRQDYARVRRQRARGAERHSPCVPPCWLAAARRCAAACQRWHATPQSQCRAGRWASRGSQVARNCLWRCSGASSTSLATTTCATTRRRPRPRHSALRPSSSTSSGGHRPAPLRARPCTQPRSVTRSAWLCFEAQPQLQCVGLSALGARLRSGARPVHRRE